MNKPKRVNDEILNEIIVILKSEQYSNCTEIADHINKTFGTNFSRRVIGDINKGTSHHNSELTYPIATKYARGFLKGHLCPVCKEPAVVQFEKTPYCKKHYLQLSRHGEIIETIFDKNEFIEYDDYYEIVLKNQFFEEVARTKIDKEDFEKVTTYKWYCHQYDTGSRYCQGTLSNGIKCRLHHFVLGIENISSAGMVVDHINGDSLDNRKNNLRVVTQQENARNMTPFNDRKGITEHKLQNGKIRYRARITVNYRTITLGTFDTLDEAIKARRKGEEKYWL